MNPVERVFFLAVFSAVAYAVWYAVRRGLDRRWARLRAEARSHASELGLRVCDVEKETIWHKGRTRGKGLKTFPIAEYSLSRQRDTNERWSFVQRYDGEIRFHNSWQLIINGIEPTTDQLRVLEEISASEKWQEEWMEIEAFPDHISVYWDDWLGRDAVDEVYAYLRRLLTDR